MSECTNHIAEAIWFSIKDLLHYLITGQQKRMINVVSGSPSSQYRNKTAICILNRCATKRQIPKRLIFLESGYDKDTADAISAQMKRKINECIASNPNKLYEKILDFVDAIRNYIYRTVYL